MSYWERRKPVLRARAVDVGEVASAAVALLDEGGLRALTLRAVAGRLGVAPASLYSRLSSVDDLFDLALDDALGGDPEIRRALAGAEVDELMLAYYRHLVQHRWACQVIAMRAPRGPNYLRLSERICVLLAGEGLSDPLGAAYALSNFVIGSATTAPVVDDERSAPVDEDVAPLYARLHVEHDVNAEEIVIAGLVALRGHHRA
ncbi:TetR/AcrR family transcriptional regulator C-terminal domain-containing protein [Conexibacter arvalis]|uniref:AcrR family transcriptional regulator n=1 Tax=Conexibacter arvalis TaxID=912552 RepID=A0A840IFV0_9ACTN|nr:TetR/AcrR family transcriptional regulator C-terminal domain-containing protein [Conexibacter arvalis]MBB4663111.1 AcrR family transcriptional regulator [Conexibacter arvalis]